MSLLTKLGFAPKEKAAIAVLALTMIAGSIALYVRAQGCKSESGRLTSEDSLVIENFQKTIRESSSEKPANAFGNVKSEAASKLIDINYAGIEDLQSLPGIGPVLAERIIEYRRQHGNFTVIDSLMLVPGIGKQRLQKIRLKITISQPTMEE